MSIKSVRKEITAAKADGIIREAEIQTTLAEANKGPLTVGEINELKKLAGSAPSVYLIERYETAAHPLKNPYKRPVMTLEAGPALFGFLAMQGVSDAELNALANQAGLITLIP